MSTTPLQLELPSPCSKLYGPISGEISDCCSMESMTKTERSLVNGHVIVVGFDQDRPDEFHECRVWLGRENQHEESFMLYIFDPDTNKVNVLPFTEIENMELNKALFEVVIDMKDGRRFSFREESDADISDFYAVVGAQSGVRSGSNSPARRFSGQRKSSMKSIFGGFDDANDDPPPVSNVP